MEGIAMTVRERMLALRLLGKQEDHLAYMQKLGVSVTIEQTPGKEPEKERNSYV